MNILNKIINKTVSARSKFFYFKFAYDRGMVYIGFFLLLLNFYIDGSNYLKLHNIPESPLLIVLLIAILTAGTFLLGHIDIVSKGQDEETSLRNQYNPEIQKLLRKK